MILFGIFCTDSIYDVLKQKEHGHKNVDWKTLTKNILWTFEWLKMGYIFISSMLIIFGWINIKEKEKVQDIIPMSTNDNMFQYFICTYLLLCNPKST
jgi:hypothetical protein